MDNHPKRLEFSRDGELLVTSAFASESRLWTQRDDGQWIGIDLGYDGPNPRTFHGFSPDGQSALIIRAKMTGGDAGLSAVKVEHSLNLLDVSWLTAGQDQQPARRRTRLRSLLEEHATRNCRS